MLVRKMLSSFAHHALALLIPAILSSLQVNANTRYDSLYRGSAFTSDAVFPGISSWISEDGDWQAFGYLGIKYGTAAKRFEPSTMNSEHGYLRNTTRPKRGYVCPQQADEAPYVPKTFLHISEDCLFLDVYVPPVYKNHQSLGWTKWPVLVWIHGGDFRMGYKDAFEAGELAASIGAIVVVPNYRLGPFGFLSSGDNVAPGNWALYDLKLALKWVHKHVHSFGGEKGKITLAGERAGGALVSMLLLDEDVRNLVHGAVTLSGNIFSPWAIKADPAEVTKQIGSYLGCFSNESATLISCLKKTTTTELTDAALRAEKAVGMSMAVPLWAPVIDGVQIQFSPSWLLDGPAWNLKGGYVTGYLTNDAAWPLLMKVPRIFGHNMVDDEWIQSTFIPSILESVSECSKPRQQHEAVRHVFIRYGFSDTTDYVELRKKIIRMTTDAFFAVPALKESRLYAKKSIAGLGNQLYVVSSDDSFGQGSLIAGADVKHLFGHGGEFSSVGNHTVEAVTRELRRLLGHVVRHGNGFGSQFDSKIGNRLVLGDGPEWRSVNGRNLEELQIFWESIAKFGCGGVVPT